MKTINIIWNNNKQTKFRLNAILLFFLLVLSIFVYSATAPSLVSVLSGAQEIQPYEDALELYIDFDKWNETYVMDRTNNNNDGLVVGANRTYGQLGYAGKFDGEDDYIDLGSLGSINLTSLSVSMWVNTKVKDEEKIIFDGYDGSFENRFFIEQHSSGNGKWGFRLRPDDDALLTLLRTTTEVVANEWVHLAGTWDGTTMRMYINGVQDATTASISGHIDMAKVSNYAIGSAGGGSNNNFNGSIDEVKIYSRALTSAEIQASYERGIGNASITTQTSLAVSPNRTNSTDQDGNFIVPKIEWWKNNNLTASSNECLGHNNSVLCMPMDEKNLTGLVEDYSVQNNDGDIVNATHTNNSKVGFGAFEFDGDGYIDKDVKLVSGYPFTIIAWAYPIDIINPHTIVSFDDKDANNLQYGIRIFNSNIEIFARDTTFEEATTPATVNKWTHIVGVFNSDTDKKLYVNGILKNTLTTSVTYSANIDRVTIGRHGDLTPTGYFNGTIDQVEIYNRSLSATEIYRRYIGEVENGLILNSSFTKKNERWNATVTLFDNESLSSTPINASYSIGNTAPNATNFINTTGLHRNLNATIAWQDSFDPDVDDGIDNLRYFLFMDENNPPTTLIYNGEVSTASPDLVALWHFNGSNASTLIDVEGGNTGTSNGGLTCGVKGRFGKGCEFDGDNDFIDAGNDVSLQIVDKLTVAAWVKSTGTDTYPISKTTIVDVSWYLFTRFVVSGTGSDLIFTDIVLGTPNEWEYRVGVYDGEAGLLKQYVNGVDVTGSITGTIPPSLHNSGEPVRIGVNINSYHNGLIDEVAIWNRALTAEEIELNYNVTKHKLNLTSDGIVFLQVKASDDDDNSSLSDVFNFTLDTTTPTLLLFNLTNNTIFNGATNFTLGVSLKDINPLNLSIRMYNGSQTFFRIHNATIIGEFINITRDINITQLAEGDYSIEVNGSDSHTGKKDDIKDLKKETGGTTSVFNDSLKGIVNTMEISFYDKQDSVAPIPTDLVIFADSNDDESKIIFGATFTANKIEEYILYTIRTEGVNIVYLPDTGFKAHLIWGDYGTDYEGTFKINDVETDYTATVTIISSQEVRVKVKSATNIKVNDIVEFRSESIFGLNTFDVFYNFKIDRTPPPTPPPSSSGADTGGSGSFQSGAEAGSTTFAAQAGFMNKESCNLDPDFNWLDKTGICYKCTGFTAKKGDDIVCTTCNEGFSAVNKQCVSNTQKETIVNFLDKLMDRFFPDNPMGGFVILASAVLVGFVVFTNRTEIIKKVKDIRKENF